MYFKQEHRVSYSECDCNNQLKISAALRHMQQTSSEQLESSGYSVEALEKENFAWLLSKMCVKINRMPRSSENIVIGTAPIEIKGVRYVREFIMDTLDGERLISATSFWLLVNPATHKILRPNKFPYDFAFQERQLQGIIDDVDIPKHTETKVANVKIPVAYSHLDVYNHVNNAVYADLICNMLPYEQFRSSGLDMLIIAFQNEARHGDIVETKISAISDKEYVVNGRHDRASCFESLVRLK